MERRSNLARSSSALPKIPKVKKVLIANRGEIAVRILQACHDLGIEAVAVYSEADHDALHVLLADEAVCIGEAPSAKSYLKMANILAACEVTGADSLHPGYGFLSENANFASICKSCGIEFIGPPPEAIALMGDKAKAKATAKRVKCPIIPGSDGVINDVGEALKEAKRIGFPVFIKATAGGGGKGIRVAHTEEEFARQFSTARTEAEVNFGCPDVYLEKMVVNPRHIEVQILADKHGNYLYLGERDCTIQRRRQKLIEEAPSPVVSPAMRKRVGEAAVAIAQAAGYFSAGTIEFLIDEKGDFFFMEMNTRIQVEHTVTEELTGIDLVQAQLRIARGEKLPWKQSDIQFKGHIIQCRINAEDPMNKFTPSPGKLDYFIPPGGPHVRLDTACYAGYKIPPHYDSMIAKLIVKGETRADAIAVGKRALNSFHIGGVKTTIPFHLFMFEDPRFLAHSYTIGYIDQLLAEGCDFVRKK